MSNSLYTCNCDVIHEDIVNDVKGKMQPKDDYIQLASLFKLFGDGTRVQILHALEQSEMCVCDSGLPYWSNSAERPRSCIIRWRMIM